MKKKKAKLYIVFLSSNVEAYTEGNHSKLERDALKKLTFNSQKEIDSFIFGLEFAGMANKIDFLEITKEEYKSLKDNHAN